MIFDRLATARTMVRGLTSAPKSLVIKLTKNIWNLDQKDIGKTVTPAKTQSSENPKYILNFAPWRPFDLAQDMLGARNFLEVILLNILSVRI